MVIIGEWEVRPNLTNTNILKKIKKKKKEKKGNLINTSLVPLATFKMIIIGELEERSNLNNTDI